MREGAPMKFASIGLTLIFLLSQTGAPEPARGTVCVASSAATPFHIQVRTPTGAVASGGGMRVRIDKRPSQPWPQKESLKIDGLDPQQRHLLAVLGDHGKPIESFWFRFSDFKSLDLCVSYDGYQGIGLQEANRSPWCKCK
jgi:hypothetical protein